MSRLDLMVLAVYGSCLAGCGSDADTPKSAAPPSAAISAATNVAYVGLFGDNAVGVIDVDAGKVLATIAVSAPDGMVITPDGKKVYVSSNDSGAVEVIDTASASVKSSVPVGAQPAGLAITSDGKYVIAAVQGDGDAAVIETATDSVVARAAVAKAHSAATDPAGTRAFVTSQAMDAPAVDVVDIPSGGSAASFAVSAAPRALVEVANKLYVTLVGSADVQVLDAATGDKVAAVTTGGSPHDVRVSPSGSEVLTVSQTAGDLEFIDVATSAIAAHVATGTMPHWIGLSRDGSSAFVTNEGDNNLVVVDLASHAVTKSIAVGKAPRKLVVRP